MKKKISKYGLSNFSLNQTNEVIELCESNGYKKPEIYQGMYNIICEKLKYFHY